jgi:hypothetical protein
MWRHNPPDHQSGNAIWSACPLAADMANFKAVGQHLLPQETERWLDFMAFKVVDSTWPICQTPRAWPGGDHVVDKKSLMLPWDLPHTGEPKLP